MITVLSVATIACAAWVVWSAPRKPRRDRRVIWREHESRARMDGDSRRIVK